ncbi:MAG: CHAT domain-containing protein, partial [Bacteroidia bacterium]
RVLFRSDWQAAYQAQTLAVVSLESMRNQVAPDSRIILTRAGRKTYEQAISLAFEMAEELNEDSLFEKAFTWTEAAKSFEFRMNLEDAQATIQAGASDSLTRKGRALKLARNYYQNKLKSLQLNPLKDSAHIAETEKKLLTSQQSLRNWEENMKDNIPLELYNNQPESLTASQVSQNLQPSEALLSFFYGDSAVYAFLVKPDGLQARRIGSRMEMDELLRPLLDNLAKPGSLEDFLVPSRATYQTTFEDFDVEGIASFMICPDGLLGYLPFSCLVTEETSSESATSSQIFRGLPYFQNKYASRYAYAAALHFSEPKTKGKHRLMAFAPSYSGVLKLAFNLPQAEVVANLWDGQIVRADEAQESRFREMMNDYEIIHLAQHAEANTEQPLASRLLFSESNETAPEKDGYLHAYEIYALNIPAQLVVLSSCESGYGPLAKGEGVMSLARAFRAAGAQSVLNTNWKVDGRVGLELMETFYSQLLEKMPPSQALAHAQRTFLASAAPELVHPHYWAAFTLVGSDAPVQKPSSSMIYWIIGLVALAGGVAYWRFASSR